MNRTVIVARMAESSQSQVAAIFGRSDATSMPREIGVQQRSLYTFHGLYLHIIDFDREVGESMRAAMQLPAFRAISDELRPHITAYDPPTWASPQDAQARCFYHWSEHSVSAS